MPGTEFQSIPATRLKTNESQLRLPNWPHFLLDRACQLSFLNRPRPTFKTNERPTPNSV